MNGADSEILDESDSSGNPRDWNGLPGTHSGKKAVDEHMAEEANPTPEQLETAIVAGRQAFKQTFGAAAFQDATTIPSPSEKKAPDGGSSSGP